MVAGKVLTRLCFFVDILTPCAIFFKVMQSSKLDVVAALTSLLRTFKETERLCTLQLNEWPVYSATLKKIKDEDDKKIYQCQELKYFNEAKQYYSNHYVEFCESVTECLRSRMQWSDQQVMCDIISMLGTQGWEKAVDEEESLEFIDKLVLRFKIPLGELS